MVGKEKSIVVNYFNSDQTTYRRGIWVTYKRTIQISLVNQTNSFMLVVIYLLFLIAASKAGGFTPTTSVIFSPFLKNRKVGMARIPSSWATSGLSSTSNLTKSTSVCSSLQAWTLGAMALQGPHHSAKASTTTSLSLPEIAASNSDLLVLLVPFFNH